MTKMIKCQLSQVQPIRLPEDKEPAKLEACRAYAQMMNGLDPSHIEPWLTNDLQYSSQWVMEDMKGKEVFLTYIRGKLKAIKKSSKRVWAEIAYTDAFGAGPCVILSQGTQENLVATMLIDLNHGKINKMCMCLMPSPHECRRTGEIPV